VKASHDIPRDACDVSDRLVAFSVGDNAVDSELDSLDPVRKHVGGIPTLHLKLVVALRPSG
jgi:hypothetical protein